MPDAPCGAVMVAAIIGNRAGGKQARPHLFEIAAVAVFGSSVALHPLRRHENKNDEKS
jgi:hypothetical protein